MVKAAEEAYTPGGVFDPDALLDLLRSRVEEAAQKGWTGVRGAGEVAWLLGRPDVEGRWGGYELRVDVLASRLPYTGLCCYDLRVCDTTATLISQAVHPLQLAPPDPDDRPLFGVHGTADGGLELAGEIDCWSAEEVRVLLATVAGDLGAPVLDVSQLRFVDVAAMRMIGAATRDLARAHGRVALAGTSPTFRKVGAVTAGRPDAGGAELRWPSSPVPSWSTTPSCTGPTSSWSRRWCRSSGRA